MLELKNNILREAKISAVAVSGYRCDSTPTGKLAHAAGASSESITAFNRPLSEAEGRKLLTAESATAGTAVAGVGDWALFQKASYRGPAVIFEKGAHTGRGAGEDGSLEGNDDQGSQARSRPSASSEFPNPRQAAACARVGSSSAGALDRDPRSASAKRAVVRRAHPEADGADQALLAGDLITLGARRGRGRHWRPTEGLRFRARVHRAPSCAAGF